MELDPKTAEEIAKRYIDTTRPLTLLGWGVSGFVYLSPLSPQLTIAVKVHRYQEGYQKELKAYTVLARHRITQLHGVTIPSLRGYRDDLNVIAMDCVKPPFLLDFAGVSFTPPDFPEDVMEHWHSQLLEMFGPNVSIVYDVYASLQRLGIYYMDFRPSNIKLQGLAGLQPYHRADSND